MLESTHHMSILYASAEQVESVVRFQSAYPAGQRVETITIDDNGFDPLFAIWILTGSSEKWQKN